MARTVLLLLAGFIVGVLVWIPVVWDYASAIEKTLGAVFESQKRVVSEGIKRDIDLLATLRNGEEDEAMAILSSRIEGHFAWLEERGDLEELAALKSYRDVPPQREACEGDCKKTTALLAGARVLPVFESGEMVGLRVTNIVAGSPWDEFGLKEGDVVASVEGIPIDAPDASVRVLGVLAGGSGFRARYDENGRVHLDSD